MAEIIDFSDISKKMLSEGLSKRLGHFTQLHLAVHDDLTIATFNYLELLELISVYKNLSLSQEEFIVAELALERRFGAREQALMLIKKEAKILYYFEESVSGWDRTMSVPEHYAIISLADFLEGRLVKELGIKGIQAEYEEETDLRYYKISHTDTKKSRVYDIKNSFNKNFNAVLPNKVIEGWEKQHGQS